VTDGPDMLIVADAATGRQLAAALGAGKTACVADPYDALSELGRRCWAAVVFSAPQADLGGLARAARRLQKRARLVAACEPAAEPEVRAMVGRCLDDYFIQPPSREDVAHLRRAAAVDAPDGAAHLGPHRTARLVEAARDVATLEACAAQIVTEQFGVPCAWHNAGEVPSGMRAVLMSAGAAPRVLAWTPPPGAGEDSRLLEELRQLLPALEESARRAESLHKLAITDHLTGAYNRRYFYLVTDQILQRAPRGDSRIALLLFDIDDFKHYNDTYSYAVGDEILREIARLVRKVTRSHDIVARIGGDEFAVLFQSAEAPRTAGSRPLDDAYVLADRFRRAVATHEFPSLGPRAVGRLSVSGGLARFPADGVTCRELLRAADHAIKRAKQAGKNAIELISRA